MSPKRAWKRATVCGASAISGTSTSTALPARERRLGGLQVDLRLARAGDAVQQEAAGGGVVAARSAGERREDRLQRGALLVGQRRRVQRARADGAHERTAALRARLEHEQAAVGEAAQAAVVGARLRSPAAGPPAASRSSTARWRSVRRAAAPSASAARPASVASATSTSRTRTRGLAARPAPGGSTSCSAREKVEQYSSRDPARQLDQLGRDRRLDACARLCQALRRDLRRRPRARRRRRAARARRTARSAASRPARRRAPPAAGSRTARAARGSS